MLLLPSKWSSEWILLPSSSCVESISNSELISGVTWWISTNFDQKEPNSSSFSRVHNCGIWVFGIILGCLGGFPFFLVAVCNHWICACQICQLYISVVLLVIQWNQYQQSFFKNIFKLQLVGNKLPCPNAIQFLELFAKILYIVESRVDVWHRGPCMIFQANLTISFVLCWLAKGHWR